MKRARLLLLPVPCASGVYKCMVVTDWKWTRTAANFEGTPSVDMMRDFVTEQFRELLAEDRKVTATRCGGFKVSRYIGELERTCYELQFILEDGDTE